MTLTTALQGQCSTTETTRDLAEHYLLQNCWISGCVQCAASSLCTVRGELTQL